MPVKSKRARSRMRQIEGLSEAAFTFFSYGPFFDGEEYELRTTPEERERAWGKHREEIITRYRAEGHDGWFWGQFLYEGAGDDGEKGQR